MQKPTPMLRQYLDLKKRYPGTILFFRLGDFYEMFNEDAVTGARELDITLTARQKNSDNPIPMCGVPHHAASNYIARLVRKGYRVAICEQTEDASEAKTLVKRDVVRIVTPGTAIDEQLLETKEPVYLASVTAAGNDYGVAFLEVSTGEFRSTGFEGASGWQEAVSEIQSYSPKELLYPASLASLVRARFGAEADRDRGLNSLFGEQSTSSITSFILTQQADSVYDTATAESLLKTQFGVRDLAAYEITEPALAAAGACLAYALETQKAAVSHITSIEHYQARDHMVLDAVAMRNLELVAPNTPEGSAKRTLLGVVDETATGMGGRLLRSWLSRPSLKIVEINNRLSAVEEFADSILRDGVRYLLKEVSDLERLVGRLNLGSATPRDLIQLRDTLQKAPEIRAALGDAKGLLLQVLAENINELPELCKLISSAISDDTPAVVSDGGVIKAGFDPELDELREIAGGAKRTIASFQNSERERTGIGSLHVKFNNVFGYFIEVSKANLPRVPEDYERRQTLTNSERFTTPQLKEWEAKVLGAEERIRELESKLFLSVRRRAADETKALQTTARALATIDVLSALAETAAHRDYVRPELVDTDELMIRGGRHPVVEAFSREPFVPNDLLMNNSTDRLLIITGANMGGKSTVLRQAALIQILAQAGSFVPATFARLPIVDRIWTRVGASDDLASGRSTFMVEMTETASILHNATPRSLILLDEIGRGTSTFDGLSIAWAVCEYLHDSSDHSAKTLFATHYHELTELANKLVGAKNYQLTAIEKDGEIVFLHKLEKGKASKSYGIAVAGLAGLPNEVIERAKEVLRKLEQYELAVFAERSATAAAGENTAASRATGARQAAQFSLFAIANESAIERLREADIDGLSDEELRAFVEEIRKNIF